jgi:hypothetical protein
VPSGERDANIWMIEQCVRNVSTKKASKQQFQKVFSMTKIFLVFVDGRLRTGGNFNVNHGL